MRIIPLLFLMILSHAAFAERLLDGMYVTGGGFISETQVDFLGSEKEISDTRPMIFVGYGKTSRMINDTPWRVFLGIEGFYMGDSKTERGSDIISINREVLIPGEATRTRTELVPVETGSYSLKQGNTYGAGIRVGLYEGHQDSAGSLYAMLGYAKTELEGQGTITDVNDSAIILSIIPQQDLDFTGHYYGIGYEYAFNTHWALRADYIKYDYSKETFDVVPGTSPRDTILSNPGRVELDQNGFFIGLTGRF